MRKNGHNGDEKSFELSGGSETHKLTTSGHSVENWQGDTSAANSSEQERPKSDIRMSGNGLE